MSSNEDYFCYECGKRYPDFNKYQAHAKTKHRDNKNKASKVKAKVSDMELADLQDKIYAFFGELAENYTEPIDQQLNNGDNHRVSGQANYLTNYVVRTPYENQIKIDNEIPEMLSVRSIVPIGITELEVSEILQDFRREAVLLSEKLEEQRNVWEFMDPLDEEINEQNEFSILNVSKLLKNYQKRSINLKYPEFTVFILWVGRICKPDSFRLFYQLFASFLIGYYSHLNEQYEEYLTNKTVKTWQDYLEKSRKYNEELHHNEELIVSSQNVSISSHSDKHFFRNFELQYNFLRLKNEEIERLIALYEKWIDFFNVIPSSGANGEEVSKKKEINELNINRATEKSIQNVSPEQECWREDRSKMMKLVKEEDA